MYTFIYKPVITVKRREIRDKRCIELKGSAITTASKHTCMLQCVAVCCSVLQSKGSAITTAVIHTCALKCVAVCCSVLQCVAVC